jgi:hypothetical protein
MITSIKELHTTIERADGSFFNYLICKVRSGGLPRYDLYRLGDRWNPPRWNTYKRLGCELPIGHCRRLIREQEPNGTVVVSHKVTIRSISKPKR